MEYDGIFDGGFKLNNFESIGGNNLGNIGIIEMNRAFIQEEGYQKIIKLKSALISELDILSDLFIKAFNDLEIACERNEEIKIWYSVDMLVSTEKNITELLEQLNEIFENNPDLTPTDGIKSLLDIYIQSDMKKNKRIDHLGENLKEWIENLESDNIIENHIFEKRSIPNFDVKQVLRHFDPETYEFTYIDKTYDIKKAHEEILKIKDSLDEIFRENYLSL